MAAIIVNAFLSQGGSFGRRFISSLAEIFQREIIMPNRKEKTPQVALEGSSRYLTLPSNIKYRGRCLDDMGKSYLPPPSLVNLATNVESDTLPAYSRNPATGVSQPNGGRKAQHRRGSVVTGQQRLTELDPRFTGDRGQSERLAPSSWINRKGKGAMTLRLRSQCLGGLLPLLKASPSGWYLFSGTSSLRIY